MKSEEIRNRFLKFFEERGHKIIPSAPLVPENDPSVLFNTAGMQPLVPYLLGNPHPKGKRLVNVQKCVRTQDIDEVGDKTHDTFFEMLGNWSLGDYFKEDAIKWSYELLTHKEEGFGLDPSRLYVTCFEGNEDAPLDEESAKIWESVGVPKHRVYFMPAKSNWWSAGENGPCGPDTEMFYDITEEGLGDMTKEEYMKADNEQKVVEIWNDVFMEYLKEDGKVVKKLANKNVDTGAGLERLAMVLQGKDNIFDTDLFKSAIDYIHKISPSGDIHKKRIITDHIRTSVFMIADGVIPSNTEQGYILRRILRRAIRNGDNVGLTQGEESTQSDLLNIADIFIKQYSSVYPNLASKANEIFKEIGDEEKKFRKTLKIGERQLKISFETLGNKKILPGDVIFDVVTTYGFPLELITEIAKENKFQEIDIPDFEERFKKHQDLSRAGAEQKFKGGLGDTSDKSLQYHTTTHLLQQALRDVLGNEVGQKGSNITPERLRFDFTFSRKMTDEEKQKVEEIVNEKIKAALPVQVAMLPKEEAEKTGAIHFFGEKYPDTVTVYYIGTDLLSAYSKEFCGGPHVKNTSDLKGTFKIQKEEAVSAGVRRIKAVLE